MNNTFTHPHHPHHHLHLLYDLSGKEKDKKKIEISMLSHCGVQNEIFRLLW